MSTKEKIKTTALEMFNEHGYQNVSVRKIARTLEISPGNLSYHYARKEDILLDLLNELRENNNRLYDEYENGEPGLAKFLELMRRIFHSQYAFRGVFIGNQTVWQAISIDSSFDYKSATTARKARLGRILQSLADSGSLKANSKEINFLVDFLSMFGRFWLMESRIDRPDLPIEDVIEHYVQILEQELGLFR